MNTPSETAAENDARTPFSNNDGEEPRPVRSATSISDPSATADSSDAFPSAGRANFALAVLTLAYVFSFVDRQILSLLVEPLKRDLHITDFEVSLLQGVAFAFFYTLLGIPIGRLADQFSRRNIIVIGATLWSAMTCLCSVARNFGILFLCRIGVGVGEATLSPSAYSLLSDYFPPKKLHKAMSIYNLGTALGAGTAYILGGVVLAAVKNMPPIEMPLLGTLRPWQLTFFVVGAPGLLISLCMLAVREPTRRVARADRGKPVSIAETLRFFYANLRSLGVLVFGTALMGVFCYGQMAWLPTMIVRTYGENLSNVGITFGLVFLVGGFTGNLAGAWAATWLAKRGHTDANLRWPFIVAILMIPFGTFTTLMPTLGLCYVSCFFLMALQASYMGPAVAALHLVTPNRMRAQLTAVLLFGMNMLGLTLGPSGVAALTDFVFKDPLAVRYSIAIVSCVMATLSVLVLAAGLKPFRKLIAS